MATTLREPESLTFAGPGEASGTLTPPALFQCLVLSTHDQHCHWFDEAAARAGWEAVICQDHEQAVRQLSRHPFPLVVVDLQSEDPPAVERFRQITAQHVRPGEQLLLVIGGEDDPLQEIWARRHGAWVYLPGIDAASDLEGVYEQARLAAEQHLRYGWRPENLARIN